MTGSQAEGEDGEGEGDAAACGAPESIVCGAHAALRGEVEVDETQEVRMPKEVRCSIVRQPWVRGKRENLQGSEMDALTTSRWNKA